MSADSPPVDPTAVAVDVRRGDPTPEELAALMAVVSESYASEAAATVVEDTAERTAWSISQRGLRAPLPRDVGWGRFIG
ncbi:acyl-CoA carboxylase subunit epsilon [Microbacterium lacus]|uniref:acyl-CoA carboxylase subunit epsilon n=1 Tax=Microbacterium lacus TaxID=415217 RepID=UPI00384C0B96